MMKRGALPLFIAVFFSGAVLYADSDMASVERTFLEGRYEKTIDAANSLIDSGRESKSELYYLKGLSELKLNRFKEARRDFEYIISRYQRSKNIFDAYLGVGDSYLLEGSAGSAIRSYNEMLERFPNDRNISVVRSRLAEAARKRQAAPIATETPQPALKTIPQPISAGSVSIQTGCFKNKRNAERLAGRLSRSGYDSYVETPSGPKDRLYRVKVGRLRSKLEAESLASQLKRSGYKTKICAE